jgi:hypothetical protein
MPWFVIYTKSRNEKKVEKLLIEKGIEAFCPTLIKKKKWSDRIKVVEEPLFRSYCFVNIEDNKRELVYSVPGFSRFLYWLKRPAIIKDSEIETIKQILSNYEHEQISLNNIQKDDKLVGVARFELATFWSQTRRDDRATLHPELINKTLNKKSFFLKLCDPDRIRTYDPQIRNLLLYPTELRNLKLEGSTSFTCRILL